MEIVPSAAAKAASEPGKLLQDAISNFQSTLTDAECRKLNELGAIRDAQSVMIFTAQLDAENRLNKGRGIAGRLVTVLESVQTFTGIIETFVSSHPEIAALVWGGIKLTMLVSTCAVAKFEG